MASLHAIVPSALPRSNWEPRVAIVSVPIGAAFGPAELERGMVQDARLEALIREGWTLSATLQAEDKGVAMILLVFLRGPAVTAADVGALHAEVAALRADLLRLDTEETRAALSSVVSALSSERDGARASRVAHEIRAVLGHAWGLSWGAVLGVVVLAWIATVAALVLSELLAALVLS